MATSTGFKSYTQTLTNAITTEANSLANGSAAVGTDIDNTTNLDLWADFQLDVTFGTNPTAGSSVDLYLVPSIDGTNFADSAVLPPTYQVGSFILRAVTTAQKVAVTGVRLTPGHWKTAIINNSGQSFPASGSTVKYRSYQLANV